MNPYHKKLQISTLIRQLLGLCLRNQSIKCQYNKTNFNPSKPSFSIRKHTNNSANYSNTWQSVDQDQQTRKDNDDGDDEDFVHQNKKNIYAPPDPITYLRKLDQVSSFQPYRKALIQTLDLDNHPNDLVLDVGCGLGGGISHSEISKKLNGPMGGDGDSDDDGGGGGHLTGIDISELLLKEAIKKQSIEMNKDIHNNNNITYKQANVYNLQQFSSQSFNVVMADRLFQHLIRPMDALQEMIRVTKEDGIIVIADPDWRTFQIDVTAAGSRHNDDNDDNEAGKRWASHVRPPSHLRFDMGALTQKILNHVIPTLSAHSYMGMALPRLLHAAGLNDIQLNIVPIMLNGRLDLESVAPITYMTHLAVTNSNGLLSRKEADLWLERLKWEGDEFLFGTLNFYICRGVRPSLISHSDDGRVKSKRNRQVLGTQISFSNGEKGGTEQRNKIMPAENVMCRFACAESDLDLIQKAEALINNEYAQSDTGITLASNRLKPGDALELARKQELIVALNEHTGALLGAIQVRIVEEDGDKNDDGKEVVSGSNRVGEFTCFAVQSGKECIVDKVDTLNVKVRIRSNANTDQNQNITNSARGRGIGVSLIRFAEAHCQSHGCSKMKLAIICPDVKKEEEPSYKKWLQKYYLKNGYEYHSEVGLAFMKDDNGYVTKDELNQMQPRLMQLVKCKEIWFEKCL